MNKSDNTIFQHFEQFQLLLSCIGLESRQYLLHPLADAIIINRDKYEDERLKLVIILQ